MSYCSISTETESWSLIIFTPESYCREWFFTLERIDTPIDFWSCSFSWNSEFKCNSIDLIIELSQNPRWSKTRFFFLNFNFFFLLRFRITWNVWTWSWSRAIPSIIFVIALLIIVRWKIKYFIFLLVVTIVTISTVIRPTAPSVVSFRSLISVSIWVI